jgi:agmatinase
MSEQDNGPHYRPPHGRVSPRFTGIRTFMRLPSVTDLRGVDVAVVGVPFDSAVSFKPGARFGPAAIRDVSVALRPYHRVHDVDLFDHVSAIDYGDIATVPGNIERTYDLMAEGLEPLLKNDVLAVVLGGDHSITLGELRALSSRYGPLAVVQLDAHVDTAVDYFGERYSHGTMFRRAVEEGIVLGDRSVQAGIRGPLYDATDLHSADDLGYQVLTSDELRALGPSRFAELVRTRVGNTPAFLSFDIDFVDPAYAPGTGGPEVAGFTSVETVAFLRGLTGLQLVGCDCVEVSPPYDSPGQITAHMAANAVWEILALVAVAASASQRKHGE